MPDGQARFRTILSAPPEDWAELVQLGAVPLEGGHAGHGIPRSVPLVRFSRWTTASAPKPIPSLSELLSDLATTVRVHAPPVTRVSCVVAEAQWSAGGHAYLWLSDDKASCRAVTWKEQARDVFPDGGLPHPGECVEADVSWEYSPAWGMRLMLSGLVRKGTNTLLTFQDTAMDILEKEGLLHANRSLPMPSWAVHVALLAPDGAGMGDFEVTVTPLETCGLLSMDRRVAVFEGAGACQSLCSSIADITHAHATHPYDVVYMVRGGGAPASLAWLDDMEILRAAARLPAPLVTGLGHERDHPLLEKLAHMACGTPSKAAQHLLQLCTASPMKALGHLADIARMGRAHATDGRARAGHALDRARTASPATSLSKGFAVVTLPDGRVAKSVADIHGLQESVFSLKFHDGAVNCRTIDKTPKATPSTASKISRPRQRPPSKRE